MFMESLDSIITIPQTQGLMKHSPKHIHLNLLAHKVQFSSSQPRLPALLLLEVVLFRDHSFKCHALLPLSGAQHINLLCL